VKHTKIEKMNKNERKINNHRKFFFDKRQSKTIDLLFILECTISMSKWINFIKEKIKNISEYIIDGYPGVILRIGFIGYRGHNDGDKRLEILNFKESSEIDSVNNFIDSLKPYGGGDEDVAGALNSATKLDWNARTRLLIHIADSPCNGIKYNNSTDSNNCNECQLIDQYVQTLRAELNVDYYFGRINERTDKMTNIFNELYSQNSGNFSILELGSDVSEFSQTVIDSVSVSIALSTSYIRKN